MHQGDKYNMTKKLQLIRGQRILNQLNELYETAFAVLKSNAKKLPSGNREVDAVPVSILKLEITPSVNSGDLKIEGQARTGDGDTHRTIVSFENIEYDDENTSSNVTFTGSDGETYNTMPISLSKVNVKVTCECLDFYWRFAKYNAKDGSLHGKAPPPYLKRSARAPANPQNVPGVCKHLIKTVEELKQSGLVVN